MLALNAPDSAASDAGSTPDEKIPVWEQQNGEPHLWHCRFRRFLLMGPSRTVMGAFNAERVEQGKEKQKRPSGAWNRASEQYNWRERAAAYDDYQLSQSETALEAARREKERAWQERQDKLQESAFALAEKMIKKAEGMLDFPLVERTVKEDKTEYKDEQGNVIKIVVEQTIIRPARWNFSSVPRMVAGADYIARLAVDMKTASLVREIENLSDEELLAEMRAHAAQQAIVEGEVMPEEPNAKELNSNEYSQPTDEQSTFEE
jgi:hypothetical protein